MADLLNNAGLESLAGFAYQMCVFILLLTKLGPDEQLEFETIDDIAIQRKIIDDVESDYSIKQIRNAEKGRKVFQVKKTTVTTEVSRKILYNWLLALKHESGEVSEFDLYIEENYKCKMGPFPGIAKMNTNG